MRVGAEIPPQLIPVEDGEAGSSIPPDRVLRLNYVKSTQNLIVEIERQNVIE